MPDKEEQEKEEKKDITVQDLINPDFLKKKIEDILKIIPEDKRSNN
jgi:hypothetical protein